MNPGVRANFNMTGAVSNGVTNATPTIQNTAQVNAADNEQERESTTNQRNGWPELDGYEYSAGLLRGTKANIANT